MTRSIRKSLVLGSSIIVVVALVAAGLLLYRGVRDALLDQFDRSLEDKTRLLASSVEITFDGFEVDFEDLDMEEFTTEDEPSLMQIWSSSGEVLYRSPGAVPGELTPFASVPISLENRWIETSDGAMLRAVRHAFFSAVVDEEDVDAEEVALLSTLEPQPVLMVMARRPTAIENLMDRLQFMLILLGVATAVVAGGLLYLVILGSLRPLEQLAAQIGGLGDADLGARVELSNAPGEIVPVVAQLNGLLHRLDTAFQRERAFSADIAHELRTPVAGLRSTLEVALSRSRNADEYREALQESTSILRQLQEMVEKLLHLGRLESGQVEVEMGSVDLVELVERVWGRYADAAGERGLQVKLSLPSSEVVLTEEGLLTLAVQNVLDNAVSYVDEGGRIEVAVVQRGTGVELEIVNSGSEVSQEEFPSLLDRFSRKDAARSSAGRHFGLGLPLIRNVVARLGHTFEVRTERGGDFRFTFFFEAGR